MVQSLWICDYKKLSCYSIGDSSNIEKAVKEYLGTIEFGSDGEYVSYARVGKTILNAIGVIDWTNLLINGGDHNIELSSEEVPVLGKITLT